MANGHGGKRPGAGRPRKVAAQTTPQSGSAEEVKLGTKPELKAKSGIEEDILALLARQKAGTVMPDEFKKAMHELAYLRQEVDFIKKIILVSVGDSLK